PETLSCVGYPQATIHKPHRHTIGSLIDNEMQSEELLLYSINVKTRLTVLRKIPFSELKHRRMEQPYDSSNSGISYLYLLKFFHLGEIHDAEEVFNGFDFMASLRGDLTRNGQQLLSKVAEHRRRDMQIEGSGSRCVFLLGLGSPFGLFLGDG
ncbi:hypothetical protein HAX54_045739, partial [Datura stramonium]|nr:hypothetical protein [Datura stramonium]